MNTTVIYGFMLTLALGLALPNRGLLRT